MCSVIFTKIVVVSELWAKLKEVDKRLFLLINHVHNDALDEVMYWASNKWFWVPLYLVLAGFIVKFYKNRSVYVLFAIGLAITLSDQISSGLIKHFVKRLRPSHEPSLVSLVRLSKAGPGGLYGFVSSHAANSAALATLLIVILPVQHRNIKIKLVIWVMLVCYSRIYNGVHYPSDVIGGILVGTFIGLLLGFGTKKFIINKTD